jgi:hypothetical protein
MRLRRSVALVMGAVGALSFGTVWGQEEPAPAVDAPLDPIAQALEISQATGAPILAVAGTET